uniref:Uncharacterized protein K02A2.6-like n=1 Tax=Haemonchus contortus TaxID=6289 RepID=W6NES8_HAECO
MVGDVEVDRWSGEPPRMLEMEVNGKKIPFELELDTSASLSIIDEKTWNMLDQPQLNKAAVAATAFDSNRIKFQERVPLNDKFAGRDAIVDVHVFEEATHSLCGRDMIRKLQIDCGPHYGMVHKVKQMPNIEIKREIVRMLDNNKRLFQDDLGKCSTTRAELKFKNDVVVPKFFRARPIPIALRPKVEAKLEEMVLKGIIRRVEHSKWATPLVVVPKPGGKIRICGDYKVTVNPQLDIN